MTVTCSSRGGHRGMDKRPLVSVVKDYLQIFLRQKNYLKRDPRAMLLALLTGSTALAGVASDGLLGDMSCKDKYNAG